ncbi:MAG TPA: hypothetical protein VM144_07470, partial [Aestuariivirga sp.]|nr:hypothetical protein [Aestuariivirga sp.]
MNIQNLPDQHEIESILGLGRGARAKRGFRRLLWLAVAVAIVFAGAWWYQSSQNAANAVSYETVKPVRSNLTVSVTATGTIQPTTQT